VLRRLSSCPRNPLSFNRSRARSCQIVLPGNGRLGSQFKPNQGWGVHPRRLPGRILTLPPERRSPTRPVSRITGEALRIRDRRSLMPVIAGAVSRYAPTRQSCRSCMDD
jgi:hypothetical protein